jgi:hypothetical protein
MRMIAFVVAAFVVSGPAAALSKAPTSGIFVSEPGPIRPKNGDLFHV